MRWTLLPLLALALWASAPAATLDTLDAAAPALDLPATPDARDAPALPGAPALPDAPEATPPAALPDVPEVIEPLGVDAVVPVAGPTADGSPLEALLGIAPPEAAPALAAGAGGIAIVGALGGFRWLALAGIALYSRLTKSDLLDNEHRERVHKLVHEKPGIALSEVAETLELGWGTTVYHLDRLERAGFLASERAGLHRCYFPVGTLPREDRKGLGALKADTTRSIATYLIEKPGATQTEMADALGLSASAASKQVTKLESAGLVRREREWKTVRLHPEPSLSRLLTA